MKKTMRAAVARAFGKPLAIEELPIPEPGAGEVLVRVAACGVRRTDMHAAEGKVACAVETAPLETINEVFGRLGRGEIRDRVVRAPGA